MFSVIVQKSTQEIRLPQYNFCCLVWFDSHILYRYGVQDYLVNGVSGKICLESDRSRLNADEGALKLRLQIGFAHCYTQTLNGICFQCDCPNENLWHQSGDCQVRTHCQSHDSL